MSHLEVHHDLATKILIGRSIPEGIPWTLDEDQLLIDRERAVWEQLTPDEQQWEQEFLADLWRAKGDNRRLPVNPEWGDWTQEVPQMITIIDDAFGQPTRAYRPDSKGPVNNGAWESWLWKMGYQIVQIEGSVEVEITNRSITPHPYTFTLNVPATRVLQEADRLYKLLQKDFPNLYFVPFGDSKGGVQIQSSYDPVQKRTYIKLVMP